MDMATTKKTGGSRLGYDAQPKYLGIKLFDGQRAKIGSIIIKQRGTKFVPGKNVRKGRDDSLYSLKEGLVRFTTRTKKGFDNVRKQLKVVNVD